MRIPAALLAFCGLATATTLQLLSTDVMIRQSTAIVRVKVTGSAPVLRGRDIYTQYQFTVLETLKAAAGGATSAEVSIPGGSIHGIRQMVAGAPALTSGQEYVIFLWTSKSGLTQIIGLSQGLFKVMQDSSGNAVLVRPAATATVVNQNGTPVNDSAVTMTLTALRTQILSVTGAGN
jgi:hypothetical protein